ncbi:unnamed protein product [Rhizophagus irregularis]|nr:unnamed protein product [Rhizophagus irregularis]
MADARCLPVLKIVTSALGGIPPYTGQEPPDKYIDTLIQSWAFAEGHMTALENANAGDFDNAVKLAGNPAINIPDTLRAWLRAKYQRETVGNQQSAIQRLTQEKFQQYDIPDTYETRIPLLLGVANNDAQVLGFLKSQLSASLEAQLVESMQVHSKLAQRLQLPENVVNSNNASIFDSHINQELKKRLGVIEINLAKLTKLIREDIVDTKSTQYQYSDPSDYNNGGLEKRLEQIEANLAKFARKDTRSAKSSQRQRSESSPFGGLEKRLGQIKVLLAKLTRNSKSRSGRVHMATADEQSDPIFSDDDISKPEDNDYNSDNSFVKSDFGNRGMNVYITRKKKVKCAEQSVWKDSSNKPLSTKDINKFKPCKIKQDSNSSPVHNASPDWKKKDSQGTKRVSLEETICKIIQIEFKNLLPYMIQQAKNYEPALAQDKSVKSKDDDFSEPVSVVSKSNEKIPELSDEEDILDGPMEIDFVQKKEPTTSIATPRLTNP